MGVEGRPRAHQINHRKESTHKIVHEEQLSEVGDTHVDVPAPVNQQKQQSIADDQHLILVGVSVDDSVDDLD